MSNRQIVLIAVLLPLLIIAPMLGTVKQKWEQRKHTTQTTAPDKAIDDTLKIKPVKEVP